MSNVTRWNPFREMATMQSALDRMFEDNWRGFQSLREGFSLPIDVHETDEGYTVHANLPGVNPDDIQITINDGALHISGEVIKNDVDENTRVLMEERFYGKFNRSISLPQTVSVDDVAAAFNHGVLTLTLPKAPEARPRTIKVQAKPSLLESKN